MRAAEDKLMRRDTCLGARGAWPEKSERGQREVGAWPAALGDCKAGRRTEKGKLTRGEWGLGGQSVVSGQCRTKSGEEEEEGEGGARATESNGGGWK